MDDYFELSINEEGINDDIYNDKRLNGLRRLHFEIDGYPVLDLTEDKDLNSELANVAMDIID